MDASMKPRVLTETGHEYLDRDKAYEIALDMECDSNAIEDYAQILLDLASSDFINAEQGRGLARIGLALQHHRESLEEMRVRLFCGLHPDAKPVGVYTPV